MIDTEIQGDAASVRGAADWLRSSLRADTSAAADEVANARSTALGRWDGDAADGYRSSTALLLAAADDHAERIGRAAIALDKYAARLAQAQDGMAEIRGRAVTGGLTVHGACIEEPPVVPATRVVPNSPGAIAHQEAVDRVGLYNQLAREAQDERAAFYEFSDAHLSSADADARKTEAVDSLINEFGHQVTSALPGLGLGLSGLSFTSISDARHSEATEFRRRSRVSGDPRIRGSADTLAGEARLSRLLEGSRLWGHAGKLMGPVGVGVDLYSGYQEGEETGDWTRASLTTGASIGTGVAVGALVAAGVVTAPAAVVVVGGAALAVGASWAVGSIYDHRHEIADWTGDRVDDVQNFTSDAWHGATGAAEDTWEGAKDAASDAWDTVTPW